MPGKLTSFRHLGAGAAAICLSLVLCLCAFCSIRPARADVVSFGDVTDPTTWTSSTSATIGGHGYGAVNITDGDEAYIGDAYIGSHSGSTGEVTVDGAGSALHNSRYLRVGYEGNGTLNITDGGRVASNGLASIIGNGASSTGEVTVDGLGSNWTSDSILYIGCSGIGSLYVTVGGTVSNGDIGYIGCAPGSTGEVTVDGAGSTWTNNSDLYVGHEGIGSLNVISGGTAVVEDDTIVSSSSGSSGTIHFDGGTLSTGGLFCATDDLTGSGTINTHGLVSDIDIVFDATHGVDQILNLNDMPGRSIAVNLTVDGSGSLGAGYAGNGLMRVLDGRVVESTWGCIGYKSGSAGNVTVSGNGSLWANSEYLRIGSSGSGTLIITEGGEVSNSQNGFIGFYSGSTG